MKAVDAVHQEAMNTIAFLQTRVSNLAAALAESQEQLEESKKLLEVSREVTQEKVKKK